MKTLLTKAHLKSMARIKDGSVNITFNTMEEVDTDDFTLMDQYWHHDGWLAFKLNELDADEIPKENATVEGSLTPSQYLRQNLFALHMHRGGKKDEFPAFYTKTMASITRDIQRMFDK